MDIIHFPIANVNSHLENKTQNKDIFEDFWRISIEKDRARNLKNLKADIFVQSSCIKPRCML